MARVLCSSIGCSRTPACFGFDRTPGWAAEPSEVASAAAPIAGTPAPDAPRAEAALAVPPGNGAAPRPDAALVLLPCAPVPLPCALLLAWAPALPARAPVPPAEDSAAGA